MGAAKKFESFPEEKYIQDGLKEGWITVEYVGMRHLVLDPDHFQARVLETTQESKKHVDMNHVHRLAAIRDSSEGRPLHPIVVFFDGNAKNPKYYVADGFHRVEENRLRKNPDIYAYVAKVPDWRHQATLYATMCNQQALLPRTREGIRKAVEMLLLNPESREWSSTRIANHCGTSVPTVIRHRDAFNSARGIKEPEMIVGADNSKRPYRTSQRGKRKSDQTPIGRIDHEGDLMSYLAGREPAGFTPNHFYSPDGDCLEFIVSDETYRAKPLTPGVTLYIGRESNEVVGLIIEGVRGLLEASERKAAVEV